MPQLPEDHVSRLRQARDPPQDGLAVPPAPLQELQPHSGEAGGLLFRCVDCPTAFCAECNGETPFDAVEGNPEWEALAVLPAEVVRVRALQRLRHREGDSGQGGEEKARSRGAEMRRNPKLAKQKREAEAKAKAEAERKAKEAEEQARAEAEAKAKAEEEAKKTEARPSAPPGQSVRCVRPRQEGWMRYREGALEVSQAQAERRRHRHR